MLFQDVKSRFIRRSPAWRKTFGTPAPEGTSQGKATQIASPPKHAEQAPSTMKMPQVNPQPARTPGSNRKIERETWPDQDDTWVGLWTNQDAVARTKSLGEVIGPFR